jgi:hypothetical protein
MYLVTRGKVEVDRESRGGSADLITLEAGSPVGEIAFLKGVPSHGDGHRENRYRCHSRRRPNTRSLSSAPDRLLQTIREREERLAALSFETG